MEDFIHGMQSFEVILMVLGVLTFCMAVAVLVYCLKRNRPLYLPVVFLVFTIIMVGFPAIRQISLVKNKTDISVKIEKTVSHDKH